jgi:ketosteroid isomerase-like protein
MRRFAWCLAFVAVWCVAGPVLADDSARKEKKDEKAIRAYFAPGMGKSDIDFKIEIDSIHVHGRTADLVSRYWFTAKPRDGSTAYRDAGRSVVLYTRDEDGRWKIRLDMDQDTPDVRFEDAK